MTSGSASTSGATPGNAEASWSSSAKRPFAAFKADDALREWAIPSAVWRAQHDPLRRLNGLASGNVVFDPKGRVLLIQRASHDSMPNRWEIPGGAVDDDDPSVLYGAARELWEETGLVAGRFRAVVIPRASGDGSSTGAGTASGPCRIFTNRDGTKTFCRFAFIVEVSTGGDNIAFNVRLDPNEHRDFYWASEEAVADEKKEDGTPLPITNPDMRLLILGAFHQRGGM